ncbi:CAMK/CAMKL/KIN4 protein kinase [Sporothrix schenckii ATCC 58251]|uniref:non-specific serine/threonine protein kinase n=1 Tax=Sporothrix schenckii (strain ATCC 58251 / de Perez 2211183) TaxID=1391915 RepID=U7PPE0_SPOS1|nr:CAMK/CAMKL/KIN4 protein kinase [Sporothrix schenckii ATCC 58251]
MSSRAALSSPVAVPSAAANAAAAAISDHPQPSPVSSERRRRHHNPPVAPPRTSSQQQQHQSMSGAPSSSSSSRRAAAATATGSDSPRTRTRDTRGDDSARRRQQQEQEYAQRVAASGGARSAAATALPIRNHGSQPSSHGPSRETSEILNSVTVSRDEVDVEREKARLAMAQQDDYYDDAAPPPIVPTSNAPEQQFDESRRGGRSRHDHSRREKQIKFGEYILGNTIGEGEFGKVKLGWKQEGGVQVAIKLIKKDILGSNPTRMAKIMREVNILRQLNHPNIVQLHKMEESEHHYGIVLEYASGGELFDYILNHRYLKDHAARRLFAQLISGVGYLHKKGIVHRDLKLENLLLDRNRNIIITDFGFANTFDPTEELTEDEEINLVDREYIKRMGFDIVKPNGMRKADLMQTSCGSPCYAAPELVVSDSLYTGRKVDVWSCGVILYAMLAGYLPFDDDPKNPEGDNINLLYKYIVNTPLTFPEYVTPHARDLLRRILVPNPRQRADLFEVARHSWLSEYANVVEFITSSTTSSADIQNIPISADDIEDGRMLGRSSSVREASKKAVVSPTIGGLISKAGNVDPESEAALLKQQKDNKRRTVQVEYVAPTTQTQRGGEATSGGGKTRARSGSQGPIAVNPNAGLTSPNEKPLPRDPPTGKSSRDPRRPPSAHRTTGTAAAVAAAGTGAGTTRSNRDGSRAVSEAAYMVQGSGGRPVTGGSVGPANPRTTPNRASFGQPVPPTVAGTNAQGRIQQPKSNSGRNYVISNPIPQDSSTFGRPSISVPPKFAQVSGFADGEGENASTGKPSTPEVKGHRRSNTIGDITDKLLGRSGSIFGGKNRKKPDERQSVGMEKASRKYPPVSMANNTAIQSGVVPSDEPRASMDSTARQSRRSFSLGLGKKRSGSIEGSQTSHEKQHTRRFSLLPGSFSLKSIGINKDYDTGPESQTDLPIQEPPQDARLGSPTDSLEPAFDGMYTHLSESQQAAAESGRLQQQQLQEQRLQQSPAMQQGRPSLHYQQPPQQPQHQRHVSASQFERQRPSALQEVTDNVQRNPPRSAPYQADVEAFDPRRANPNVTNARGGRVVLQKNKRMADAYDTDEFAKHHDRSGSSGAARRVMDFFRRRAKARGGDE